MSSNINRPRRFCVSIGTRLTLLGAGVTFLCCALLSIGLYLGLRHGLQREVDTFLEGEIPEFMLTVNEYLGDDQALERALRLELGSRTRDDLAFRLLDADGFVLVSSKHRDSVAELWHNPSGWFEGTPQLAYHTVKPPGEPFPYRTCSLRIETADGGAATAQVSYRLDRTYVSLAAFRRFCLAGLGLALILSLTSGRWLARRILNPIRTLNDTTGRIGAERLAKRVPTTGSGDELDRLAITINEMLDRLERHVIQVRQLTADASHELRTPLAALRGSAEVALTGHQAAEDLRAVLARSIDEYDRLSRITDDLLLLARADAGHEFIRRERVRLDCAVADVIDLFGPTAEERGVDLAFMERGEVWIDGDDGRVRQMIGNLVDNAIKFTPPGGAVRVSLTASNGWAEVAIGDTGIGIAPEHLSRVFDRFYRVDRARSRQSGGGAGLGLAICRTIAEAHDGNIDVSSHLGVGTTALVHLPRADVVTDS